MSPLVNSGVVAPGVVAGRLAELGLQLPPVVAPVAAYVPATRVGTQIWTSGQLPMSAGALSSAGKVGSSVSIDDAVAAAQLCALNALAAAAEAAGGLDAVARIVKVVVFVASDPSFTAQPTVANGASQLFLDLFGDAGRHVRSAVGVSVLPLDAPVEVELIVETR